MLPTLEAQFPGQVNQSTEPGADSTATLSMRRLSGQDEVDKDLRYAFGHVLETSSTEAATETKAIAQDESVEHRLRITPRLIQISE